MVFGADTHLELLDSDVSGARFRTGCVFERDIAHRRSVAVLCKLYMIYNPMLPLYGSLHGPYVPVRVTRGVLVSHRYIYSIPRCRTSLYIWTSNPLSGTIFPTLYLMLSDWLVSRAG